MLPIESTKHLPHSSGIYRITNARDGKNYVGSSKDIRNRCMQHIRELTKGTHHGKKLLNAWRKHGSVNFTFHVLELCSVESLVERETWWMNQLKVDTHGYNTYSATPTGRGYTQTPEHVEKRISPRRGKPQPQNVRDAVAAANKRRIYTTEQRDAARKRMAKWKSRLSKEELSHRLSESMKGRVISSEQRKKISESKTGQTWRDKEGGDVRAASVGGKLRGRVRSQETREKMSVSAKKTWSGSPEAKERAHQRSLKCWASRKASGKQVPVSTIPEESK